MGEVELAVRHVYLPCATEVCKTGRCLGLRAGKKDALITSEFLSRLSDVVFVLAIRLDRPVGDLTFYVRCS